MAAKKSKRTTLRSSKGKKLYAVRRADGTFKDIQSYKRAHAQDIQRSTKAETAMKTKTKAKKR
jgi:DNA-binding protein HU-beta